MQTDRLGDEASALGWGRDAAGQAAAKQAIAVARHLVVEGIAPSDRNQAQRGGERIGESEAAEGAQHRFGAQIRAAALAQNYRVSLGQVLGLQRGKSEAGLPVGSQNELNPAVAKPAIAIEQDDRVLLGMVCLRFVAHVRRHLRPQALMKQRQLPGMERTGMGRAMMPEPPWDESTIRPLRRF